MNLLHGYVLKEHVGPFFFAFFVLMFVLVIDLMLQMMKLLFSKGIGVLTILEFFFLSLAWMTALAVPMAILVATLMAFGRLSEDNEITALKAGGVSFYRLLSPVILSAIAIALLLVIFNNDVLPEFNHRARNLMSAVNRKKPALTLKDREGLFIEDFPGLSILLEKVDEKESKAYGITIYEKGSTGLSAIIRARSGDLHFSQEEDRLTMTLHEGEIHRSDPQSPDQYLRSSFDKHVLHISNIGQQLVRKDSDRRGDREMSPGMMRAKVREEQDSLEKHRMTATKVAQDYLDGYLPTFEGATYVPPSALLPGSDLLRTQRKTLQKLRSEFQQADANRRSIDKYAVEIHKKYSIPVACIVFVLLGAPLGILARSGGMGVGFGLSVGFIMVYWAFLIGGESLADRQIISPWVAMWSPNILLGAVGIYLVIRASRGAALFRWKDLRLPGKAG
ncbi:MAG: LptF/LptG family permease [Candidatus Latescibacterota bacterium]